MTREQLNTMAREFTDKGKLIEVGWIGLRLAAIPIDAPQLQIDEMRNAFFAGAQHLFGSIMGILDPGAEPTDADLNRLTLIDKELRDFLRTFELNIRTEGSA